MAPAPQHVSQAPTDGDAPRKPYVIGTWLAFDPDETLAEFFTRRAAALQAGDQAWRAGTIKAHHQKLYERLVDAVGAHQYSWIKVETLADEFSADVSTIKRWLTVLEKKARLIRRQRQFKTSSRTYLVAYDQWQTEAARDDQAAHGASDAQAEQPNVPEATDTTSTDDHAPPTDVGTDAQAADPEAGFFKREGAPTYSAFVPPHIKDPPLNTSSNSVGVNGGRIYTLDITSIDPALRAIIDDEVITSDYGRHIIAARPLDELRAVQGYLDRQTNVRDRAGLFVWLNERQFGAELLAGRTRAAERQPQSSTPPPEQRRRRRGRAEGDAQRPARPAAHDLHCAACGHISAYLGLADAFCEQCGVQPGDELGKHDGLTSAPDVWHAVLNQVDIAPADRDLWLAPCMLARYDELLVLACPHKLVCEAIATRYLDQIDAATSALLGRPAQIELAVKYMPTVTEEQRAVWLHAAEQPSYPAWLRDDDHDTPTTQAAHVEGQQLRASTVEAVVPCEEVLTLSPPLPSATDTVTLPILPPAHQEIVPSPAGSPPLSSLGDVWSTVCTTVAIPPDKRRIWIDPTSLLNVADDTATISAPNIFVRNRLATHYHDQLAATLSTVVGRPLRIEIVTEHSSVGTRS